MTGAAQRPRDLLWSDIEGTYAGILAHPFLTGLADGTLPRDAFGHYIVQDAHYLRGYARALAVCAARRPAPPAGLRAGAGLLRRPRPRRRRHGHVRPPRGRRHRRRAEHARRPARGP